MGYPPALLLREEGALALDAPAVAADIAVFAHDAMAGDGEGDAVGGARLGDGAGRRWLADGAGDLAIGARAAVRDGAQCLPDAPLEGRRLHIQRQIEVRLLAVQMADDRRNGGIEAGGIPRDRGGGIFLLQRGREGVVRVTKVMAQMPRSVAATSRSPSGQGTMV